MIPIFGGSSIRVVPESSLKKATMAEALYKQQEMPVNEIASQLKISKTTLYKYLRYRGVEIKGA